MTIRHIVLFHLHDDVSVDDDRVRAAAAFSATHVDHIPDIQTWETGFDLSRRAASADFVVIGTFTDRAAISRYLDHPHHRAGVAKWGEIARWTVADISL